METPEAWGNPESFGGGHGRNLQEFWGRPTVANEPFKYETVLAISAFMACLQIYSAWDLWNKCTGFVGTQKLEKLQWSGKYSLKVAGAKPFPPTRYVPIFICIISAITWSLNAAQEIDKLVGNPTGFYLDPYKYVTYLFSCPTIMYDHADTLNARGVLLYSIAVFISIFMGVITEIMLGVGHWVAFIWGCVVLAAVLYFSFTQWRSVYLTCKKYKVSQNAAFWILWAGVCLYSTWPIFAVAWILRNDIDSSHGWISPLYLEVIHAALDIIAKPIWGYCLLKYKQETEEIHLQSIIKAMRWNVPGRNMTVKEKLPPDLVVATIPTLLRHAQAAHESPELKAAFEQLRAEKSRRGPFNPGESADDYDDYDDDEDEDMEAPADRISSPKKKQKQTGNAQVVRQAEHETVFEKQTELMTKMAESNQRILEHLLTQQSPGGRGVAPADFGVGVSGGPMVISPITPRSGGPGGMAEVDVAAEPMPRTVAQMRGSGMGAGPNSPR